MESTGSFELKGRKAFFEENNEHLQKVSSLEIKSMLIYAVKGSTHGTIILNSGEEIYFAEMYKFENHQKDAKVKEITSYIIMKP